MAWWNSGLLGKFEAAVFPSGAGLGDAWKNVWNTGVNAGRTFVGGIWNMVQALGDRSPDEFAHGFGRMLQGGAGGTAATGISTLGAASKTPVLAPFVNVPAVAQQELVKRPISTYALVGSEALPPPDEFSLDKVNLRPFFNADTWRRAYNDSATVSTGQAVIYGGTHYREIDPRTPGGQQFYTQTAFGKATSGSVDATIDWFADPTIYGGKAAKAAKLRYISKPMRGRAIAANPGLVRSYIDSERAQGVYDFARNEATSPEHLRQVVYNNHTYGGWQSNAVYAAAKIEDPVVSRRVYDNILRVGYGEQGALEALASDAPDIAAAAGDHYANYTMGDILARAQAGDQVAQGILDARKETNGQAFAATLGRLGKDQGIRGDGMWSHLPGTLIDQNQPRVTITSRWRYNIHQAFNGAPLTIMGQQVSLPSSMRMLTPSGVTAHVIYLDIPNQESLFRANLEGYKAMRPEQIDTYTSAFARATSRESRYNVLSAAEDDAFRAIAAKHGFTPEQAETVMAQVRQQRSDAFRTLTKNRKYFSDDAAKVIESYYATGQNKDAQTMEALRNQWEAAKARGEMPSSYLTHIDEDGNAVLFPEFFHASEHPLVPAQHAAVVPMMNGHVLHQALRWAKGGKFMGAITGESREVGGSAINAALAGYRARTDAEALTEAVSRAWKIATLMRPGYAVRTVPDDAMRAGALMGQAQLFLGSARGLAYSAVSAWRGAKHALDVFNTDRYRNWGKSVGAADVKIDDAAPPVGSLASRMALGEHAGDYAAYNLDGVQVHDNYERAFADGALSLDDLVGFVEHHADLRPGTLPRELATIVQSAREKIGRDPDEPANYLQSPKYRRKLADYALGSVGRDAYADPDLRRQLIDEVASGPAGSVRIDPFAWTKADTAELAGWTHSNVRTLPVGDESKALRNYVLEHADELLKPRSMLDVEKLPHGEINLSIARATDSVVQVPKLTGGKRLLGKNGPLSLDVGMRQLVLRSEAGPQVVRNIFQGAAGDQERAWTSATSRGRSHYDRMSEYQYREILDEMSDAWKNMLPDDPSYPANWERVVNSQFGTDPVFRQFLAFALEGRPNPLADVTKWMRSPEGRGYVSRLGPWRSVYEQQAMAVNAVKNLYVPGGGVSPESKALYRDVLNGKATYADAVKVAGDPGAMPMIHGAIVDNTGKKQFFRLMNKLVSTGFRWFADMPTDKIARFPLAAERFRLHAQDLMDVYAQRHLEAGGEPGELPLKLRDDISKQAAERARSDVARFLFDNTVTHDLARLSRFFVPFGSAAMDAYVKWGRIFQEKPWTPQYLWKIWTSPEHAGLVQDDSGNRLRIVNGKEQWQWHDMSTDTWKPLPDGFEPDRRVILLPLPSFMKPKDAVNANYQTTIDKNTLNVLLNLPSAGPLVGVPMNNFALDNPEFADNKFIKTFVYPYGPSQHPYQQALPATWRNWLFTDKDTAEKQAIAIYVSEATNFQLGLRHDPPTYEEARQKAADLRGVRFLYQFGGFSPQFQSPFQPYVDYYHNLQQMHDPNDPMSPDEHFVQDVGDEYFWLTASYTRNRAGIPATMKSWKDYQKYKQQVDQHPEIAGLIVGRDGAGAFSNAVYQAELAASFVPGTGQKMREPWSLEDTVNDVAVRQGWLAYSKLMDSVDADMNARGLHSLEQKDAADLKELRDKWIADHQWWDQSPTGGRQLNPWWEDFHQQDDAKMVKRLNAMMDVLSTGPEDLRQRDDMRGLIDYLLARQEMQALMDAHGYRTLNTQQATVLRDDWDRQVTQLRNNNLAFAQLYHYWLTGDQYLSARVKLPQET